MSLTNDQITAKNFKKFYDAIQPYFSTNKDIVLNGTLFASGWDTQTSQQTIIINGYETSMGGVIGMPISATSAQREEYASSIISVVSQNGSSFTFQCEVIPSIDLPVTLYACGTNGDAIQSTGFTPIGTIISVMGKVAPKNYLICDGSTYDIDAYPELANYFVEQFESVNFFGGDGITTFAVPDLRGEFLRGTGTNSHMNQGSGANVGTHQDATEHLISWNYQGISFATGYTSSSSLMAGKEDSTVNDNQNRQSSVITTSASSGGLPYSHYTSRPTNTSVLYCIATKNIYVDARYNYSTEESVVGTWIDGKPIYQKTMILETPLAFWTNAWKNNVAFVAYNIDNVVNAFSYTSAYAGSNATAVGMEMISVDRSTGYYNVFHPNSATLPHMGATIQYTKTTD